MWLVVTSDSRLVIVSCPDVERASGSMHTILCDELKGVGLQVVS